MSAPKKKNPLAEFNLNSILVLAASAYVGWQVTTSLSTNKKTNESVGKIETTLPFISKAQDRLEVDVKEVKNDVKEAKTVMVTRNELQEKNNRLTEAIKEVKSEVGEVRQEQSKVKDELTKRPK